MVMVPLKGVHRVKQKGRVYFYAWRGGPRMEAEWGTPEFLAEWLEKKSPTANSDKSKLAGWVELYRASAEFQGSKEDNVPGLALSTRELWNPWLDRIKEYFGHLSIRLFDRPQIRVDIAQWRNGYRKHPRAADTGKQVLSRVLSYAVEHGGLTINPCAGIPNLYEANRAETIWTADDLALFCAKAPEMALAARLASLTGLRLGDLLRLAWTHVGAKEIVIPTGKSRGRRAARVPLTADIRATLEMIPKRALRVLTTSKKDPRTKTYRPWTNDGFGSSWATAIKKAELGERDLHFHDLRGTAATNFYRAGLTIRQIAEILAWSEDRVERLIDRYVKRDEIVADMVRRIEAGNG